MQMFTLNIRVNKSGHIQRGIDVKLRFRSGFLLATWVGGMGLRS